MDNKAIIPVILLLLAVAYPASAFGHTEQYLHGLAAGLVKNPHPNACDIYLKLEPAPGTIAGWGNVSTPDYVHCMTGFDDGEYQQALASPQYKVGYRLGENDKVLGIFDSYNMCKRYGTQLVNFGPEWFCVTGYSDAQKHSTIPDADQLRMLTALHQSLPYKTGFAAGVANNVGVCNQFNGRDNIVCSHGQDIGFKSNMAVWEKTSSFKHGYKLGLSDAKLKITGDSVGDCDIYNLSSTENLCEAGYDAGWAAGGGNK